MKPELAQPHGSEVGCATDLVVIDFRGGRFDDGSTRGFPGGWKTVISRRAFFKYTGGSMLTLYVVGRNGVPLAFGEALPGGSLDPVGIAKFTSALLIPPVMPRASRMITRGSKIDYYEIAVRQFKQQVLPK